MKKKFGLAVLLAAFAALVLPAMAAAATVGEVAGGLEEKAGELDMVWVAVATVLVFLMQAGFTALESGLVRSKNSINVAIKNFASFLVAASLFWVFGYGLMFGSSEGGLIGTTSFLFEQDSAFLTAFFLFQVGFVVSLGLLADTFLVRALLEAAGRAT